jgi:hypothetical protein
MDVTALISSAGAVVSPDDLSGMAIDFDHYLGRLPSIRRVTVSSSPDPARQLTARCVARRSASARQIAREITKAWRRDLRYRYAEAHELRLTREAVELEVVTRIGPGDYVITGLVVVTWPPKREKPVKLRSVRRR